MKSRVNEIPRPIVRIAQKILLRHIGEVLEGPRDQVQQGDNPHHSDHKLLHNLRKKDNAPNPLVRPNQQHTPPLNSVLYVLNVEHPRHRPQLRQVVKARSHVQPTKMVYNP